MNFLHIDLSTFQWAPFALHPRGLCLSPLKQSFTQLCRCPGCKPHCFSKPGVLGGSSLQCRPKGLGCLMWGLNPSLTPQGNDLLSVRSLPPLDHCAGDEVFGKTVSLPLPAILMWSFILCCGRAVQLAFKSFSEGMFHT